MSAPVPDRTRHRFIGRRFFKVGGLRISTYLAMLYVGCVLGIALGAARARASGMDEMRFVLATVALMIPAFAGSRLWFVAQRFEQFRDDPRAIWRSSEGGAALYGGLAGGVLPSPLVLSVAGLPFWQYWDAASVTMLVAVVVTRFGCLMNGCCVGRETTGRFGMWLPDHRGDWRRRFPTQILESVWAATVLVVVLSARTQSLTPGIQFAAVVAAYAAGRLLVEPTRATAAPARTTYVNLAFSACLVIVSVTAIVRLAF